MARRRVDRAYYLFQPFFRAPAFHGPKQLSRDRIIIYTFKEAEVAGVLLSILEVSRIPNSRYTPDDPAVTVCKEVLHLRLFVEWMAVLVVQFLLVDKERCNPVLIRVYLTVKLVRKHDKPAEIALIFDCFDYNCLTQTIHSLF